MKEFYNQNRKPILIIFAALLIGFLIYRNVSTSSENKLTPAVLSFESSSETLTSESTIKVKVDTKENPVGFVQVVVKFDQSKVSLKEDMSPNPIFKTVVKNSTVEEANETGTVILAIGLEPGTPGQQASFDVGALIFEPKTSNETVTLSFDTNESQIVTMNAKPLPLEKKDLTISTQ